MWQLLFVLFFIWAAAGFPMPAQKETPMPAFVKSGRYLSDNRAYDVSVDYAMPVVDIKKTPPIGPNEKMFMMSIRGQDHIQSNIVPINENEFYLPILHNQTFTLVASEQDIVEARTTV